MNNQCINNRAVKKKLRKIFARRRPKVLRSLIMRDKRVCGICSTLIAENETCTIDHIIALSQGGTNDFQNLQLAHERCNSIKGKMSLTSKKAQNFIKDALEGALHESTPR